MCGINHNFLTITNYLSCSQNVETLNTSADEMEMYASVNRKFRQIYTRQEHMKTFKTYDRIEVSCLYIFNYFTEITIRVGLRKEYQLHEILL